ncbi:MAG: sugar phosphate isomerase/epimerase [Lachnospiraceae bacterium]|nr:sugar phosphate isomerase/epimerase [Lachnospiraceae bacterium]
MKRKILIIPDIERIDESLKVAEKYDLAFEYNDFYMPDLLDDSARLKKTVETYKSLDRDRSNDTLHGVFYDITVHSDDPKIKQISEDRIKSSLDIATELGVTGVIFHTNYLANFKVAFYEDAWVERNVAFWSKLVKETPNLNIYIENMFDEEPGLIVRLFERLFNDGILTPEEKKRIGICFDYAHANAFGNDMDLWENSVFPYVKHMHINDNDLKADLHQPMGEGKIDWARFNRFVQEKNINSSVLVEMKSIEGQIKSLEFMKENHIYPYDK